MGEPSKDRELTEEEVKVVENQNTGRRSFPISRNTKTRVVSFSAETLADMDKQINDKLKEFEKMYTEWFEVVNVNVNYVSETNIIGVLIYRLNF